jgi:hypothetical protein
MFMRRYLIIGISIILAVTVIVVVAGSLTPQNTNPAFAAATTFMEAAGKGDESGAYALLSDDMRAWVGANCPNGSASACIKSYAPPEWGSFLGAVYRRSVPDGPNWNVEIIATYEKDKGGSGVCIFERLQQDASGAWKVYGWGGFVSCGDPRSRNMPTNPDTPNRAP